MTDKAGVRGSGFMTGAAWADYDRDGNVDLFVARYVHLDMDKLPQFGSNEKFCRYRGILVQCGPVALKVSPSIGHALDPYFLRYCFCHRQAFPMTQLPTQFPLATYVSNGILVFQFVKQGRTSE